MKKITIEQLENSLRNIINRYGYDGTEIPATKVNDDFTAEYVDYNDTNLLVSNLDGSKHLPFTSLDNSVAEEIYNKAVAALGA